MFHLRTEHALAQSLMSAEIPIRMLLRVLLALSIVMMPARADDSVIPVFLGGIILQVPNFPGMVQLPAHTQFDATYAALTPFNAVPMRQSIPADLLDHGSLPPGEPETLAQLMRPKDTPGDVDDSAFLRVVQAVKSKLQPAGPGNPAPQSILFESSDAISVLSTRNYAIPSPNNRVQPVQSFTLVSYLHIKNRLLIAIILRVSGKLGPDDLADLKATITLYVDNLHRLNKS